MHVLPFQPAARLGAASRPYLYTYLYTYYTPIVHLLYTYLYTSGSRGVCCVGPAPVAP